MKTPNDDDIFNFFNQETPLKIAIPEPTLEANASLSNGLEDLLNFYQRMKDN